ALGASRGAERCNPAEESELREEFTPWCECHCRPPCHDGTAATRMSVTRTTCVRTTRGSFRCHHRGDAAKEYGPGPGHARGDSHHLSAPRCTRALDATHRALAYWRNDLRRIAPAALRHRHRTRLTCSAWQRPSVAHCRLNAANGLAKRTQARACPVSWTPRR